MIYQKWADIVRIVTSLIFFSNILKKKHFRETADFALVEYSHQFENFGLKPLTPAGYCPNQRKNKQTNKKTPQNFHLFKRYKPVIKNTPETETLC